MVTAHELIVAVRWLIEQRPLIAQEAGVWPEKLCSGLAVSFLKAQRKQFAGLV